MKIFDETFGALEKAMDLRFKRHMLISSNVANGETPGYRARELDFAGELDRALNIKSSELRRTNSNHMDVQSSGMAHVIHDDSGPTKANGNNVDLDLAMGKLSTNARGYSAAANFTLMKLRMIRLAARGSGGSL